MPNPLADIIQSYYQRVRQAIDADIQAQAGLMRDDIVTDMPVDTGALRASIQGPNKIADGHYQVVVGAPYAWVVEHGGYPGVGPKTVKIGDFILEEGIAVEGGIFPSQKPAAPVRRAIAARKKALRDLAKRIRAV